jgi:hypothetical protein
MLLVLVLLAEVGVAVLGGIGVAVVVYCGILLPLDLPLSSDLARRVFAGFCFIAALVAVLRVDSWLKIPERIIKAFGPADRHAACGHEDPLRTATVSGSPQTEIILRPSWALACLCTLCMAAGLSCLFTIVWILSGRHDTEVAIIPAILVVAISASVMTTYLLAASTEWRLGIGGVTQYERGKEAWHVPWVELCSYQVTLGITFWLRSRSRKGRTALPFVSPKELSKAKQMLEARGIPTR